MSEISNTPASVRDAVLEHSCAIVAAYLGHNPLPAVEIPAVLRSVHGTLLGLSGSAPAEFGTSQKPAVPIKKSVTPDYIVCLEDGKKLKMLKRYLRGRYGLSPDAYRAKWGLPADYPLVAPNYAQQRSQFAKKIGLGRTSKRKATARRKKP